MPGSKSDPPVLCTGCPGANVSGQNNDGLPTYPFSAPIIDHVGRYVDSNTTPSMRSGFRTARARFIEVADTTRGSAPPRVYVQIGNGVGVYSLDTFFTSRLPGGMVSIGTIFSDTSYDVGNGRNPLEKILKWDAFVYPEAGESGWQVPGGDFQDPFGKLHPIDFDDRGYVYIGTERYGWGIVADAGQTSGAHLAKVVQALPRPDGRAKTIKDDSGVTPHTVLSFKVGTKYYLLTADTQSRALWDVTNPGAPSMISKQVGIAKLGVIRADHDRKNRRIAYVGGDSKLYITSYDDLVNGAVPLVEQSGANGFQDVAFDEHGTLWAAEAKHNVWRFTPAGNNYTSKMFTPFVADFEPLLFHAQAGFIAVGGVDRTAGGNYDVKLLRIEANGPKLADTDAFFRKYYHAAPPNYAQPGQYTSILAQSSDVQVIKHGGKTYLMYSGLGFGDVFELEGGATINIVARNSFGITNPNAKPTENGPFYGDVLTFVANSSSTETAYDVKWDFGDNTPLGSSRTGEEEPHQYTGLTTAAQITAPKIVRAQAVQDPNLQAQYTVNLKVPTPRVGINGKSTAISASTTGVELVFGNTFTDASDGAMQGHIGIWTRDTDPTARLKPNEAVSAGGIGAHTLKFQAQYGAYDTNLNITSPYEPPALNISYTVKPFLISLNDPVTDPADSTKVKFTGNAEVTRDPSVLVNQAAQWTVTWTLNGNPLVVGGGVGTNAAQTVPYGDIPPISIAKSQLADGQVVGLQVSLPVAALATVAQPYAAATTSLTLSAPDPVIETTGCQNANSPCKFTAKSAGNKSMAGWTFLWTLTRPSGAPLTGTAATFEPGLTAPGNYTITLKATKTVFESVVGPETLTVGGTLCGPLPPAHTVEITKDNCVVGSCPPGSTINFFPTFRGYAKQDCDTYAWDMGDGTTYATPAVTHTYNQVGTYTVRLTMSNPASSPLVEQTTVTISTGSNPGGGDPPQPTCTAPTAVSFTYSASTCTNTNCRTTDNIVFTARRGNSGLQNCDSVRWEFGDGTSTTDRQPVKNFPTAGTYPVKLTVTNNLGSATSTQNVVIVNPPQGDCTTPPMPGNFVIQYTGAQSGCDVLNGANCTPNETISFDYINYYYVVGSCDTFEWDFGDGSAKSSERKPSHKFAGGQKYTVRLKITNAAGTNTYTRVVPFANTVPTKPIPVITATTFPSSGHKGKTITFVATSNLPTTTGWTWNFGDGSSVNTSQAGAVSQTSTITHTFSRTGNFTVQVSARHSEDAVTAPVGTAQGTIAISEPPAIPEYKFLLPVTAYTAGQGGSAWRTDVQIYNPDPQVSEAKPLVMEATFKGVTKTLTMIKATHIYENFLGSLLDLQKEDSGPVIITTKSAMTPPQIWTRTYTQTANGTFGQFIPAIRIDNLGGGAAPGDTKYYMSGLRHDSRYRTNVGFLNPNLTPIAVTVTVYDAAKFKIGEFPLTLQPFQLDQFQLKSKVAALPDDEPFSIKIDVPAGSWIIGYASFIDGWSNDPAYIQAVPENEVASSDFKTIIVPGVGHTGQWRSDVVIFNPDAEGVMFDLTYYNPAGVKKGEALSVPLKAGEFLEYGDILKQGVLGNVEDGVGMLKISVKDNHEKYPMAFARTYFDNGANGTYGQGIAGFAAARANVKPGKHAIIAGVRNSADYKTNIGLVNLAAGPVTATVTLLDPVTGAAVSAIPYTLQPAESLVGNFNGWGSLSQGTFKIEATGNVWAFCSITDAKTRDPEYVPAVPVQ